MKTDSTQVSTFQNGSSLLDSSKKNKLLCSNHQQSQFNCLSKSCQNYAFVCQNNQCPCRQDHRNCLIVQTKTITSSILAKIIPTSKISACVDANIEKLIDELSDFRDKILVDMKQRFRYCGLNQGQKDLVKKLDEGNADKVTGSLLWKAHLDFERVSDIQTNIQLSLDQINKYMLELQIHVASGCVTLQSLVKQLDDITFQIVQNNEMTLVRRKKLPELSLKPQSNTIFLTSKILQNSEEISTFLSFMPHKNIKNVILLYRASQNNFDVSKFHKNCDNMPFTLTLCTTQFNKKIGGYTPIPWMINPSGPKIDSSKQSFIFSITNKDKLDLVQVEKAVYHSGGHGPWFGMGNDFIIHDKADKGSNSHANVNSAYRNAKYKYADRDSWEKFGGNLNNSCCFKIKQWEVWKLEFQ